MTGNQNEKYIFYTKMAWAVYTLMTIALVVVLVLFVAQDNEERFFYGIMPAAASYVLRPTERFMNNLIFKLTGVSQPADQE
jgi:hypothetical protein